VEVDMNSVIAEKEANHLKLGIWLVDIGVGSLLDPIKGLPALDASHFAKFKESVKKIFVTYDLRNPKCQLELPDNGVLTIRYGLGKEAMPAQKKNVVKHLAKLWHQYH
jgi:hypothetical protein